MEAEATTPTAGEPAAPTPANALDPEVRLADLSRPADWTSLFGNANPVHLEIGTGSGHWTAEYARRHPDVNLVAVELYTKQVRRAVDKFRRRALANIRALRCDAVYFLVNYVGDASLDAIHVYFPDPWFKKRHLKRRLIRPDIAAHLWRTLKPGGLLHVKTDIAAYQVQVLETLEAVEGWRKTEHRRLDLEYPRDAEGNLPPIDHIPFLELPEDLRLTTNYERKALVAGHPIHLTRWRKE